ncbi:VOC family protein [Nakamurella sp. UYEF19]|uniref:bleomycin resistance protein n=1 Tax=Nakamurella sp. UYEF19 TaxID=1756392 RepID=UPI003396F382
MREPGLVPELLVSDIELSVGFWCSACGFKIRYARPEERFAYIMLGTAHLMLEEVGVGRNWITGPLERPLGRGINFQIIVPDADEVAVSLGAAGVELFMPPETKQYQVGTDVAAVRQFLVADPDGYLVRFQSPVDG